MSTENKRPLVIVAQACASTLVLALLLASFASGTTNETNEKDLPADSQAAARKLSDSFMADLIAGRISAAADKVNSEKTGHGFDAKWIREQLTSCGAPLDSKIENDGKPMRGEFVHAESRDTIYATGPTNTTLTFLYVCRTARQAKRRFTVEVELESDGKNHVSSFGCLKRTSAARKHPVFR